MNAVCAMSDHALARELALNAGKLLIALQRAGGADLGREGDRQASALITSTLSACRPGDAILCEEEHDNPKRLQSRRVWIVDPLDGTREFSEGRTDWAVHVALSIDGAPSLGAVALPGLDLVLCSDAPPPLQPVNQPPRMLVSRTRPAPEAVAIASKLGASLLEMGSAGAKAMAVVRGEADIYLHSGGQFEWDNCAPVAVARAARLHASRADGGALIYNQQSAYLPDLLICKPELAEAALAALRG